jgi:hypothetical protein
MPSHSDRLRQKIELVLPELADVAVELASHPNIRELYADFLVMLHQGMRASVSLLQTAFERCQALADTDPVAAALAPYYGHHIKEEDHDYWALEDLEVLGISRAEALQRIPSASMASMVGAQYYWVLHHHPVAMLGDMMVREGYQSPVEVVDELVGRTGHPRSAFRTMERHCHLDIRHGEDLIEMVDGLPLEEEHHTVMGISALHTIHMMVQSYREILEGAPDAMAAYGRPPNDVLVPEFVLCNFANV